jgi:ribosomal protein S1
MELSKWQKAYPVGTVLVARVVFVDHATKSVRLSLRPHVLEMRAPKNLPERGSLLTNISVRVMNKKIGVLLTSTDADSYEDEEEEEADEEGDGEGKDGDEEPRKRISKKKKRAEAERKRRDRDEAVQGVFIHRSSLAQVPSNPEGVETEDAKTAQGRDTSVETEQMEKTYPVGMEMSARVIGYHLVEGWAVASNMKSFMHADVVHSSQLHAGQVVEGTVQALKDFGIIVLIGGKVRAVCPALHLSDSGITGNSAAAAKAIAQKFKVGQTTRFRVWEATGDGFVLTCKKTLVNDTTSKVISSYDDAEVGMVVPGVIASINDDGLRVHFYNKVRGFVPMAVLVQQGVVDALDSFQVGQILRCVVLRKTIPREYKGKKPAKAKPYLTLGMDVGDAATNLDKLKSLLKDDPRAAPENPVKDNATSAARTSEGFNAYEFVSGTVTRQDDDSLFVQLDDSRVAVLSKLHLADSALTSKAVASSPAFAVGARVEDALLLSSKGKNIQISKKPLLVQIAKLQMASSSLVSSGKKKSISEQLESNSAGSDTSIPCRVSDLAPGQLVAGVVWNVESYGVLVKFRDNLTALAPRANLADKFVPTPVGLFEVGDSIRCAVQRVDYAKDRVIVTFKSAFVPPSRGPHCYLLSRLNDELRAAEASSKSSALPDWRSVAIGGSAHASVVAVKPYGVVLQAMSGPKKDSKALPNTMMLARDASDETFNRGDVAKVVVLDMDVKNNVFDVSLSSETLSVVEACVGKKKDKPRSALEVGAVVSAKILLVKEYYLVVITSSGIVGYVMVADYHCSKVGTSEYSVGQELSVCVEQSPSSSSQSAASPYTSSAMFSIHQSSDSGKSVVAALAKKVQREAEDADEELHGKLSSTDSKHHPKGSSLETLALTDPAAARQKFLDSLRIGSIMKWQVTEVTPLELHVAPEGNEVMGLRIKASVHITGAVVVKDALNEVVSKLETSVAKYSASGKDGGAKRLQKLKEAWSTEHPFYGITVGQKIGCRIVQIRREEVVVEAPEPEKSGKRKRKDEKEDTPKTQQQISVYLAMVSRGGDADKDKEGGGVRPRPMVQWRGRDGVKCSTIHPAFVVNVEAVGVVVALSPYVSARLSFMDISSDLSMVQRFKDVCNVGMSMLVGVTKVSSDNGKSHIEVSRAAIERYLPDSLDAIPKTAVELEVPAVPKAGAVVSGIFDVSKRVRDMPAFTIHLAHNRNARVCVTEVAEPNAWVDAGAVIKAARAEGGKAAAELAALAKTNDLARMHGSIVHARILSVSDASDNEHKVIEASTRESRVVSIADCLCTNTPCLCMLYRTYLVYLLY